MRRPGARHPFALWLSAASLSTLGDAVTFFALGWVASGHGPGAAGLVLTVEGVPLCLLILVGGLVADRWGIRRTMAACDLGMAVVMAVFAAVTAVAVPLAALVALALLAGTAAALRRPAEGVFPRLFATGEADLTRRVATTTLFLQVARIAGPAVGGLLLALGGLPLTSVLDAVTFVLVLGVLLVVRPPHEPPAVPASDPALRRLVDGFRVARRTPGAPAAILAVVGLASTVLPLVSLCVPLVGRERGWTAHDAGLVAAAWVVGGLAVTAWVARRGAPGPVAAVSGPVLAAAGTVLLAATHGVAPAFAAVLLVGTGTSMLTSRLLPTFVAATPPDMLARFQSLLGIAQTGPVLLVTPLLAAAAGTFGAAPTTAALAVVLLLTALPALAVERVSPAAAVAR